MTIQNIVDFISKLKTLEEDFLRFGLDLSQSMKILGDTKARLEMMEHRFRFMTIDLEADLNEIWEKEVATSPDIKDFKCHKDVQKEEKGKMTPSPSASSNR